MAPVNCLRACQLEKLGVLENGKFNLEMAMNKNEEFPTADNRNGLEVVDYKKISFKNAVRRCFRELYYALEMEDKCLTSTAVYYCIRTHLKPHRPRRGQLRSSSNPFSNQYKSFAPMMQYKTLAPMPMPYTSPCAAAAWNDNSHPRAFGYDMIVRGPSYDQSFQPPWARLWV